MAKAKTTARTGKSKQDKSKVAAGVMAAVAVPLSDLAVYQPGAIVSRVLTKSPSVTMTAFAFDAGQSLSEHSSPFDAYVIISDGVLELTIGGELVTPQVGEMVLMPAGVPHSVHARQAAKMLRVMIRSS